MKTSLLTLFATLLIVSLPSTAAHAGGESSGGGDLKPSWDGSAWFLGDRPIRYCMEIAADFGLSSQEIQGAIESSIVEWKSYVASARIQNGLNLNYVSLAECDSTEDLHFYFGVNAPKVVEAKKDFFKPSFFAHRESYDLAQGWGKGFVWIAGPSEMPNRQISRKWSPGLLRTALLHEFGHLLGCAHIDGTIMRERIAAEFYENEKIDQERMLVMHLGTFSDTGLNFHPTGYQTVSHETFEKFTGIKTTDPKYDAEIRMTHLSTGEFALALRLSASGKSGDVVFEPMRGPDGKVAGSIYDTGGPSIFKIARDIHSSYDTAPSGMTIFGTVKDKAGNSYFATYEINMNILHGRSDIKSSSGPVGLFYFDKNQKHGLYF